MAEFGAYHLSANPGLYEPVRTNNFILSVSGLDRLKRAGVVTPQDEDDYVSNGEEILRLSVASSSIPHFGQSTIEVKRGNSTIKFAGVPTFSSGSIKIRDFVDANGKEVLLAWQALSYDVVHETIGRASEYKKTCTLMEYTSDYKQLLRTWTLEGCWISGLSEDDADYDSNNVKTVTATITYDRAIPNK